MTRSVEGEGARVGTLHVTTLHVGALQCSASLIPLRQRRTAPVVLRGLREECLRQIPHCAAVSHYAVRTR